MSSLDPKSKASERLFGRVTDPVGGPPDLVRFFKTYDEYFRNEDEYSTHVEALIAEYSRGDEEDSLRAAFDLVIDKIQIYRNQLDARKEPDHLVFPTSMEFAEIYRNVFVLLAIGLCLSATSAQIEVLADNVERGDALLELLIASAAPGLDKPQVSFAFRSRYGDLYDCIAASSKDRSELVRHFLDKWYSVVVDGFAFKDMHLEPDPLHYVGYWCFEAAGIVAALGIDDSGFKQHPNYPADLVAMYRNKRGRS
jgi:hypothetical protein